MNVDAAKWADEWAELDPDASGMEGMGGFRHHVSGWTSVVFSVWACSASGIETTSVGTHEVEGVLVTFAAKEA